MFVCLPKLRIYLKILITVLERVQNGDQTGYFTSTIFKEHIKPRLLQLFGVRDSQVRMLILTHFSKFVHMLSHEELSKQILPEVCNFSYLFNFILV